jgi:hypothetical protein
MVQSTWQQVVPIANQAASLFYGRLFELDPNLKGNYSAPKIVAKSGSFRL